METITHAGYSPPQGSPDTLSEYVSALNTADHALVLIITSAQSDLGECVKCDPSQPPRAATATVSWTNHLERLRRVSVCPQCVGEALQSAVADGWDVTLQTDSSDVTPVASHHGALTDGGAV